jgi:hypothetical protein
VRIGWVGFGTVWLDKAGIFLTKGDLYE